MRANLKRTEMLYDFSKRIAAKSDLDDVLYAGAYHLAATLACRSLILMPNALGELEQVQGYPAIEETGRWVVGVEQAHVAPFVPRITLTLPTLAACNEMLFLVSGHDKRAILTRVLEDPALPAARARSLNKTTFLVDAAAMPERKHA